MRGFNAILDAVNEVNPALRLRAIVTAMEAQNRHFHDDLTLLLIDADAL